MRSIYASYLTTPAWETKRRATIVRDGRRCASCGATDEKLVAHHTKYPNILGTEPVSDLITLCEPCHRVAHTMDPALKPPTDSKVLASLRRCAIVFDLDLGSEHAFRYVDDIFRDGFWCLFRIPGEKKPVAFNEALQWSTEMRGNTDQHRIMSTQRLLHIARLIPIPAIAELFLNDIKSSFPDIDWREPAAPTPVPTPITDIVDPGIKRLLCYALASREAMSLLFNRLKEVWGDDIPEPIMDLYSIGISENDERVLRARDDYIAATEGRLDPVAEVAAILDIFLSRKARTKKES